MKVYRREHDNKNTININMQHTDAAFRITEKEDGSISFMEVGRPSMQRMMCIRPEAANHFHIVFPVRGGGTMGGGVCVLGGKTDTMTSSRTRTRVRTRRKKRAIDEIVFPTPWMHHTEFEAAWDEWKKYRKERKKSLTASTVKRQLKFLATFSSTDAIAVIHASIQNGWVGLFAPKTPTVLSHPKTLSSVEKSFAFDLGRLYKRNNVPGVEKDELEAAAQDILRWKSTLSKKARQRLSMDVMMDVLNAYTKSWCYPKGLMPSRRSQTWRQVEASFAKSIGINLHTGLPL